MSEVIRIFVGFDPRETVAWHVLVHSILARSSRPVSFVPLALRHLGGVMWRERSPLQSTDFSFSRFLVPYLSGYQGWSIFMDCDMLVLADIAELWGLRDERYAVMCVKHDHRPQEQTKFLDAVQTRYEKKNWSSVMLFNNERCRKLTPEYVNNASGLDLHQFRWLDREEEIGALPEEWNYLVGYSKKGKMIKNVHFTLGGPYFWEFQDCEYSREWLIEKERMLAVDQRGSARMWFETAQ